MRSQIDTILTGKAKEIYKQILDSVTEYADAASFIQSSWNVYKQDYPDNPSLNGRIFEYLVAETLIGGGICPFYYQAQLLHVPNCEFDIVLYQPKQPVVLSVKVSLRERYKQADLEGMALKQVYRQARHYLITLSEDEADRNRPKIANGDSAGLDDSVVAAHRDYNQWLDKLGAFHFVRAEPLMPIEGKIC